MTKNSAYTGRTSSRWAAGIFFMAGSAMLVNVIFLWVRFYTDFRLSILWAAIPGIVAFVASIIGLITLYPRLTDQAPWLARGGFGLAMVASAAICIASLWLMGAFLLGAGIPEPLPVGFLALTGIFLMAMVLSFICTAAACLIDDSSRIVGYLLTVPVALWGIMLVVGAIHGLESGLSLDYYTNGPISLAFLGIGFSLQTETKVTKSL